MKYICFFLSLVDTVMMHVDKSIPHEDDPLFSEKGNMAPNMLLIQTVLQSPASVLSYFTWWNR